MTSKIQVVNLNGDVTIARATELRATILEALEQKETVLAGLGQATDIDLAGIQLLYAAKRFARSVGRQFHLTGTVPDIIADRLFRAGVITEKAHNGKELEECMVDFGDRSDA